VGQPAPVKYRYCFLVLELFVSFSLFSFEHANDRSKYEQECIRSRRARQLSGFINIFIYFASRLPDTLKEGANNTGGSPPPHFVFVVLLREPTGL
jgi:hypothetical protein